MPPALPTLPLVVALALLTTWLGLRLSRRWSRGRLVEVERRFESTLQRFRVEIDRFKFTRQSAVKILLNHDHAVWTQVEQLAHQEGVRREALRLRVNRYVEEIVPFFKPLAYFSFGSRVARWVLRLLYRVDFRPADVERVRVAQEGRPRAMIYVANHRSNVDYVLMAHVLAERLALSFAVGEWARVWPLEYLFKSFGSYFLRRGFRDPLYHTILRRYVQLVTKNGVTQALFPEGGLSRDGKLRAPKLGLIDYIVCSKEDRSFTRELVFVPVAINYDRVLEDRALVAETSERPAPLSKPAMVRRVLGILFGNVMKFARSEIRKNGIAAVRFGDPISFDAWLGERGVDIFALSKEERRGHIAEFCNLLLERIAERVPATPLCVVSKVLLERCPTPRAGLELYVRAEMERLAAMGVEVIGADRGHRWITEGALLRLELRRLVVDDEEEGLAIPAEAKPLLRYYANALVHFDDGRVPRVEPPAHEASRPADETRASRVEALAAAPR